MGEAMREVGIVLPAPRLTPDWRHHVLRHPAKPGLKVWGSTPFLSLRFDPGVIDLMTGVPEAGEAGAHLNLGQVLPSTKRHYIRLLCSTGTRPTIDSHGIDGGPCGSSVERVIQGKSLGLGNNAVSSRGDFKIHHCPGTRACAEAAPNLTTTALGACGHAAGKCTGIPILGIRWICVGKTIHRSINGWTECHQRRHNHQRCRCRMGGCATTVPGDS